VPVYIPNIEQQIINAPLNCYTLVAEIIDFIAFQLGVPHLNDYRLLLSVDGE
jgi:hypothetical protein